MNTGKTIFTFPTHTLVTVPFLSCIWSVFYYCRKLIPCLPFFCLTMSTKWSGKLQPAFLYCSACPLVAVTICGTDISLNNPKYPTISAFSGHILMRNRSKKTYLWQVKLSFGSQSCPSLHSSPLTLILNCQMSTS